MPRLASDGSSALSSGAGGTFASEQRETGNFHRSWWRSPLSLLGREPPFGVKLEVILCKQLY
jgi:hypothetical protein